MLNLAVRYLVAQKAALVLNTIVAISVQPDTVDGYEHHCQTAQSDVSKTFAIRMFDIHIP